MRVALCCLAKCEHLYINDFVKWYVNIGVDTIYLFDNDNIESPNIRDFIDKEYLKHVVIFDIRGLQEECMQQHIYDDFYKKYKNNFDWCLFCDIDEYLIGVPSIKTLLKLHIYDKINQILSRSERTPTPLSSLIAPSESFTLSGESPSHSAITPRSIAISALLDLSFSRKKGLS